MIATIDDKKCSIIGMRLADIKALQELLIESGKKLSEQCDRAKIHKLLQNIMKCDRKNLETLN